MKMCRFFFSHVGEVGSFSQDQFENLRQRTLGDVICDNTPIASVPNNVFLLNSGTRTCPDTSTLDVQLLLSS